METPAPLPATRQITRPRTPRKQESLGTRRSEKSTPQKAPKRKASSSVVRPTPTKKPFLQKNRTGLAPKKLLPVCNEQCVYCRKTLDDQEPHYSWNCTYVSVHGIDNNCDDTSSPELRRSQKKYVKLAIATSQKCRVHLQDGKKRVSEALLLKLNPCGAKCCLSCAPAPKVISAEDFKQSHRWIFTNGIPESLRLTQYKCPHCQKPASLVMQNAHRLTGLLKG